MHQDIHADKPCLWKRGNSRLNYRMYFVTSPKLAGILMPPHRQGVLPSFDHFIGNFHWKFLKSKGLESSSGAKSLGTLI